jgi:hypothetical protein
MSETKRKQQGRRLKRNFYKERTCDHWECGIMECCHNKNNNNNISSKEQRYPRCHPCSPTATATATTPQRTNCPLKKANIPRPILAGFMLGGESVDDSENDSMHDSFTIGSSAEFFKEQVTDNPLVDNTGQLGFFSGVIDRRTGQPHGEGTMVYEDVIYEGHWVSGDWSGFGCLTEIRSGDVYQGGFFDNMKHGLGVMKYKDGRVYDGTFQFDKLAGKGHMTNTREGTKFWGYWNPEGIPHGRGKLEYGDGRIYDGELDSGILQGHGRMTWPSGKWFLGEWSEGVPNGLGIEVTEDGTLVFEGMYCHGKPIHASSFPHCQKSSGRFLLYRSSVACRGTLVGPLPRQVCMRKRIMKWAL